jgi:hypothetical protein
MTYDLGRIDSKQIDFKQKSLHRIDNPFGAKV